MGFSFLLNFPFFVLPISRIFYPVSPLVPDDPDKEVSTVCKIKVLRKFLKVNLCDEYY